MAYIESELGRQAPRPDYGEISQSTPADELVRLVRKRYPDWDNFAHPAFVKDEIDYKRKAAARARELLGEKELRDLLTKNRADEIFQRLMKVAEATNLLYRSVPRTGDLSVLNQPDRLCQRGFWILGKDRSGIAFQIGPPVGQKPRGRRPGQPGRWQLGAHYW
jgi:hypothetical protein